MEQCVHMVSYVSSCLHIIIANMAVPHIIAAMERTHGSYGYGSMFTCSHGNGYGAMAAHSHGYVYDSMSVYLSL